MVRSQNFEVIILFMKSNRPRFKPAFIAKTRWAAYATAGVASSFISANSAEATIHYSGLINQDFRGCDAHRATFQLDQPGDFIRLRHDVFICYKDYGGGGYFGVRGLAGASFAGLYPPSCNNLADLASVSRLERGNLISNRPFVRGESGILATNAVHCGTAGDDAGQFDGEGIGYIGFKFNNGSGDQYGWVRIWMSRGINENDNFRLIDYAYGDVGEPIRAGQTSSNEMVPEEGSLGWLALGAAGLVAWRKRRSQAAS
jgi:MYXO-CTERM domain-containing protein